MLWEVDGKEEYQEEWYADWRVNYIFQFPWLTSKQYHSIQASIPVAINKCCWCQPQRQRKSDGWIQTVPRSHQTRAHAQPESRKVQSKIKADEVHFILSIFELKKAICIGFYQMLWEPVCLEHCPPDTVQAPALMEKLVSRCLRTGFAGVTYRCMWIFNMVYFI